MRRRRFFPTLASACLLVAGLGACNDPPVDPLDRSVAKGVRESIASGGRTAIDVLWVIDNSNSMCEEQANLAANFETFIRGLAILDADVRMAVVTTDITDPDHTGRFQANPARDFTSCRAANKSSKVFFCLDDDDCGQAGCLCGVPHLRRCASDDDCDADSQARCVASGGGSTVRFCSPPCAGLGDCRQTLTEDATDAFWCGPSEDTGDRRCLLRVCDPARGAIDCAGADGYQCVPSGVAGDGATGYCRLFENRDIACPPGVADACPQGQACRDNGTCPPYADCPAPTCDCPADLDNSMAFAAGNATEAEIDAAVRSFRCLATVGTEGDDIERGLGAVRFALTGVVIDQDHPDFFREEAHLVIVMLSDEDDCTGDEVFVSGGGLQCGDRGIKECVWCKDSLESVVSLADFVQSRKEPPWKVVVAAIVGDATGSMVPFNTDPSPSCASDRGVAFSSDRYTGFVREFDRLGVVESICGESFEGPLQRLAALVVSLSDRFCLEAPVRRCATDDMCAPGSRCGHHWGESGQCVQAGEFVGVPCDTSAACAAGGFPDARCDDRRFCKDPDGDPKDLQVRITREGDAHATTLTAAQWSFLPDATYGCLQFAEGFEPGPEDAVEIGYLSSMAP